MGAEHDYPTIASVDLALRRALLRRSAYRDRGLLASAATQDAVIDRLLARRFVLMGAAA